MQYVNLRGWEAPQHVQWNEVQFLGRGLSHALKCTNAPAEHCPAACVYREGSLCELLYTCPVCAGHSKVRGRNTGALGDLPSKWELMHHLPGGIQSLLNKTYPVHSNTVKWLQGGIPRSTWLNVSNTPFYLKIQYCQLEKIYSSEVQTVSVVSTCGGMNTEEIGRRALRWCFYTDDCQKGALAEPFTQQMDLQSEKSVHCLGPWIRLAWRFWVSVLQERKKPQFVKSSSYQMEQGRLYVMACREDNWKLQSPAGQGSAESCRRSGESAIQAIFLCCPVQTLPGLFPYLFLHRNKPNIPLETFKFSMQYFWHSNTAIILHDRSSFLQDFYLQHCREFLSKFKTINFMFNFFNYSHLQVAKELIYYKWT